MDLGDMAPEPTEQLAAWIEAARTAGIDLPEAFTLATVSAAGEPSARMVLARGLDAQGLRFYTNRESRKGRDLAEVPRAAAVFHWATINRQARLAGAVQEIDPVESQAYFASRPRDSRISAWASAQGQPIEDRVALDARWNDADHRFHGDAVPMPPFWGGYLIIPEVVEFWESRPDRLHDRIEYLHQDDGSWTRRRLQP
ncbi:MAG: pyridoxamine 5'-phosphate oxidase [Chloroflexota bacterium]